MYIAESWKNIERKGKTFRKVETCPLLTYWVSLIDDYTRPKRLKKSIGVWDSICSSPNKTRSEKENYIYLENLAQ